MSHITRKRVFEDFRPGKLQTSLLSYRSKLEYLNFSFDEQVGYLVPLLQSYQKLGINNFQKLGAGFQLSIYLEPEKSTSRHDLISNSDLVFGQIHFQFKRLFMPPTWKKLRGHIAFGLYVHPSICQNFLMHAIIFLTVHARVLKLHMWIPHWKKADPYFFFV